MQDQTSMPPPPAPVDDNAQDSSSATTTRQQKAEIERQEEQKLRAKYPQAAGRPIPGAHSGAGGGGHSAFLQKRLAKGNKYFDSGDYQMAKQKTGGKFGAANPAARLAMPSLLAANPTGETIPTPELVPARKTSIIQPVNDHTQSMHLPSDPAHVAAAAESAKKPMANPALADLASS